MKAIEFENVGKQYRLGLVSTGTISHDLNRWWTMNILHKEDPYLKIGETNDRAHKGQSDYVWALKDINFSVEQGDVVGIIGKNGAGKSTLLKLLSRVTAPTTGLIKARGRIASLLEVGTGFHPEMTGRENIYLNGAIMGMTKQEISRKLDEIVDFSGCERYIDEFQKKAIGKMQDVSRGQGRTVLFVSHNMASVKSLCNRGVVLKDGQVDYIGEIENAVNHYLAVYDIKSDSKIVDYIVNKKHNINISKIEFNGTEHTLSTITSSQRVLNVCIEGDTDEEIVTDLGVVLKNKDGVPMAALAEGHSKGILQKIEKGHFKIERNIQLPKFMGTGDYNVDICMHHPMVEFHFQAIDCAVLHIDGYQEGFGRSLIQKYEGFVGLESLPTDKR